VVVAFQVVHRREVPQAEGRRQHVTQVPPGRSQVRRQARSQQVRAGSVQAVPSAGSVLARRRQAGAAVQAGSRPTGGCFSA